MADNRRMVEVGTPNKPGSVARVDAEKYAATKNALLKLLPKAAPGLSFSEMHDQITPLLPDDLFPGGAKRGWWVKTVQLDLETKGVIKRADTKPLRWYRK